MGSSWSVEDSPLEASRGRPAGPPSIFSALWALCPISVLSLFSFARYECIFTFASSNSGLRLILVQKGRFFCLKRALPPLSPNRATRTSHVVQRLPRLLSPLHSHFDAARPSGEHPRLLPADSFINGLP